MVVVMVALKDYLLVVERVDHTVAKMGCFWVAMKVELLVVEKAARLVVQLVATLGKSWVVE